MESHRKVSRRAFALGAIGVLAACSSTDNDNPTTTSSSDGAGATLGPAPEFTGELKPLVEGVSVPPDLPETAPTLFRGVRLFDGDEVTEATDVILQAGLVAAIGAGLDEPDGAEVVDGAGHTLLPGMIDAHTHSFPALQQQSARFGVLTELDMFTVPDLSAVQDAERSTGATDRADVFSSMSMATAPEGYGTHFQVADLEPVTDVAQAEAWVQDRVDEGAAYIKIAVDTGSRFPATLDGDIVAALVDAAHDQGLRAIAHAESSRDVEVVLASPVDGLAHTVSRDEMPQELVDRIAEMGIFVLTTSAIGQPTKHKPLLDEDGIMDRVDPSLVARFRRATLASDERWAAVQANLVALHAAGVPLIAGTEAPAPGTTGGAGLLVEVENLVDAGLSPDEALHAATARTADTFGLTDRGRIAEGLRGDVVLVEGDPTADITDLRGTVSVWKWGVPVELSLP